MEFPSAPPAPTTLEELKLQRLEYLRELQQRAAALNQGVEKYFDDPVGFARECIDWGKNEDAGLTFYQEDILRLLVEHKRVAARGPHGLGKAQRPPLRSCGLLSRVTRRRWTGRS